MHLILSKREHLSENLASSSNSHEKPNWEFHILCLVKSLRDDILAHNISGSPCSTNSHASSQNPREAPACRLPMLPQSLPSLSPIVPSPHHHMLDHNSSQSPQLYQEVHIGNHTGLSHRFPEPQRSHRPPEPQQRHPICPEDSLATRTTGQKTREETETWRKKHPSKKGKLRNLNLNL